MFINLPVRSGVIEGEIWDTPVYDGQTERFDLEKTEDFPIEGNLDLKFRQVIQLDKATISRLSPNQMTDCISFLDARWRDFSEMLRIQENTPIPEELAYRLLQIGCVIGKNRSPRTRNIAELMVDIKRDIIKHNQDLDIRIKNAEYERQTAENKKFIDNLKKEKNQPPSSPNNESPPDSTSSKTILGYIAGALGVFFILNYLKEVWSSIKGGSS